MQSAQRRKHASGWKTSKARCCCFPPKTTPCGLTYEAARRIVRRLEDGGFRYPVIERAYHRAGHYLFPVESRWHKLFANARRYPQDYMAAARDALAQTLDFFHGRQ